MMRILKRVFGEPLVQFLLIGAGIFAGYALIQPDRADSDLNEITVTRTQVDLLAQRFQASFRRPPTARELDGLIDHHIREEVLVREAQALAMDRDDPVIRQRLAQKMLFLIESVAGAREPTAAELRDYFAANIAAYTSAAMLAFDQVYLGQSPAPAEIDAALAALRRGDDPAALGRATLLPGSLPLTADPAIAATFGAAFPSALAEAPVGEWTGPVASGYGLHLVRISQRRPAAPPAFETVRDRVERDWRADQASRFAADQTAALVARYAVTRPAQGAGE